MDLFDIAVARKLSGGGGGGGSSDFTTCTLTITGVDPIWAPIPSVFDPGPSFQTLVVSESQDWVLEAGETYQVPLYKGQLCVVATHLAGVFIEGNAVMSGSMLIITGDFSMGYK